LTVKFDKKTAYATSLVVSVIGMSLMGIPGKGQLGFAITVAVIAGSSGIFLTLYNFLFQSLQGDAIDYDELLTGMRREAQYNNLIQLTNWFFSMTNTTLPFIILDHLGFRPNGQQSEELIVGLSLLISSAALFFALSFVTLLYFPITKSKHEEISEGLAQHKRGENAVDPFTGKVIPPHNRMDPEKLKTYWFFEGFSHYELQKAMSKGFKTLRLIVFGRLVLWILIFIAGVVLWGLLPDFYYIWGYLLIFVALMFLYHLLRMKIAFTLQKLGIDPQQIGEYLHL